MLKTFFFILSLSTILSLSSYGQDELLLMLESDEKPTIEYVNATFKTTRLVIGQSIENPATGNMVFIITHHFGALNTGYENLFGLQQASIRIGGEYGLTTRLAIGAGLNTERNTWDGFIKYKILRQSKGAGKMPLSLSAFVATDVYTTKWEKPDQKNYFTSRMSYVYQILLARKFTQGISLQIMPSLVHVNLVPTKKDKNDIFTIGVGGRVKISKRMSINAEYHYLLPDQIVSTDAYSSFSLGVDIETGGHVFQIFCTNSLSEHESGFLANTRGRWSKGDIYLGFNITRVFTIVRNQE